VPTRRAIEVTLATLTKTVPVIKCRFGHGFHVPGRPACAGQRTAASGITLSAMATVTIAIDVDETLRDALARAAEAAGQSIAGYLTAAAADRMLRDAGAGYASVLASHPQFALDVAAARQAALRQAADARAEVLAKYECTDGTRRPRAAAVATS